MHPLAAPHVPEPRPSAGREVRPLSSVDDLHDADFDQFLADRLAESADAVRAAVARVARTL